MDGIRTRTLAPVAAIALLGMTAAYVQLTPTPGYTSSAPAQASAQGSRADAPARAAATPPAALTQPREQVVTARRGSITDTITLSGRIGAADEVPLSFPSPQRVGAVNVGPGDTVTEGQVLVEADQSDLAKSLGAARERLAAATSKLRQAQDAAGKQQRRTEIRQTLATNRAQQGVLDAEAGLRQAEVAYEKIKGGASTAERRAAETAVSSARAALVRAEADLNKLREGTDDLELRQAQQSVMVAQVAYQKAQDDYQKLQNGPDQTALRAAERDFLTAASHLVLAEATEATAKPADLLARYRALQRVLEGIIAAGMVPYLFVEGTYDEPRLAHIAASGLPAGSTVWAFDRSDMKLVRKHFGGFACFGGNVPVSLYRAGTVAQMEDYCKRLIDEVAPGGGFFLASGAPVDEADPAVVRAFMRAAEKFGAY